MNAPRPQRSADAAWLATLTVLLVEDDGDAREQMGRFLARRVGELVEARDGSTALGLFVERNPAIVVTDIQMPRVTGLTLAEEIRIRDKDVPIIVVTAFESVDYLRRSIDMGVGTYLTKPVDGDRLEAALLACARRLRIADRSRREERALRDRVVAMQAVLDGQATRALDSVGKSGPDSGRRVVGGDTAAAVLRQLEASIDPSTSVESVAAHLTVSPRTLRRRLDEEGTSFKKLFDAAREVHARRLLAGGPLALAEIASSLGFQSTSSFGQAFKRWTGVTPGQYRETRQQGPASTRRPTR